MKVYTYRYFWKDKDGHLCVKYLTDTVEAHEKFMSALRDDITVLSAMREYQSEVDFAYLGYTQEVKKEQGDTESV